MNKRIGSRLASDPFIYTIVLIAAPVYTILPKATLQDASFDVYIIPENRDDYKTCIAPVSMI